jgi:hypothetical protein
MKEHSIKLQQQSQVLDQHSQVLDQHSQLLNQHQAGFEIMFRNMTKMEERLDLEIKKLKGN